MSDHTPLPLSDTWLARLQAGGCRITAPRRALVEILAASHHALGALELFELARAQQPAIGLVTVYRTLETLDALGLVQRVHQPGGCHAYLPAREGHTHILLCTRCGRAEYFSGDNLSPLIRELARGSGFTIHDHLLQLFGICADCAGAAA